MLEPHILNDLKIWLLTVKDIMIIKIKIFNLDIFKLNTFQLRIL